MPLLNYTTEVPVDRTLAEISKILRDGGASAVMMEYNGAREVDAVSFRLKETSFGECAYRLPANVPAVILHLNAEIAKGKRDGSRRLVLPLSLKNNKEQAERIAWRIVKDWLEAQVAINQVGAAKLEQVMLPFAVDSSGETFYQRLVNRGGPLLLQ